MPTYRSGVQSSNCRRISRGGSASPLVVTQLRILAPLPNAPTTVAYANKAHKVKQAFQWNMSCLPPSKKSSAVLWLSHVRRRSIQVGVRLEPTDQRQAVPQPVSQAGQVTSPEAAVSHKTELSLGKPANQHGQQLPHQFGGSLLSPPVLLVPLLGMEQLHGHRQGKEGRGERMPHEGAQCDPFVSPTERRVCLLHSLVLLSPLGRR